MRELRRHMIGRAKVEPRPGLPLNKTLVTLIGTGLSLYCSRRNPKPTVRNHSLKNLRPTGQAFHPQQQCARREIRQLSTLIECSMSILQRRKTTCHVCNKIDMRACFRSCEASVSTSLATTVCLAVHRTFSSRPPFFAFEHLLRCASVSGLDIGFDPEAPHTHWA